MVRASTLPLRLLALQYGADFCFTEELIDKSLLQTLRVENTELGTVDYVKQYPNHSTHNHSTNGDTAAATAVASTTVSNKNKNNNKKKRSNNNQPPTVRTAALILRIDPVVERNRLVCQLGTGDAETAVRAALHVHRDVSAIDVNMGCPKPFSVGGGMGSALLQDPERACRIISSLVQTLAPLSMPVSAKIRLLPGGIQPTLDFVTGLVNAGAAAVTIHGRYVGTPESTAADWDTLRQVTALCTSKFPHTSILVNGDFYTRHEFTEFQHATGAAGVVLARPALYNTSIFIKPTSTMSDSIETTTTTPLYSYDSPLLLDPTTVVQDYLQHAVRYQAHYKNIKYVVCEMRNLRRHPTARVPYLAAASKHRLQQQTQFTTATLPTVGQVCNCHSLEDICQLWKVDYTAAEQLQQHRNAPYSTLLPEPQDFTAGEHTYSDAYLLAQPQPVSESTSATSTDDGTTVSSSSKRARVDSVGTPSQAPLRSER